MSIHIERATPQPVPDHATQHMVRMRDGIRLATDVYLPDETAPVATVLVRLPYDKNSPYVFMDKVAPLFTARGYAMVVQDVRGKFRSEGHTLAWTGEVDDGYDTIEWIVNQGWSDGIVGMFGDSYYGFTQWSAVSSQHPALRAIVPRVTATSLAPGRTGAQADAPPSLEGVEYLAVHWTNNDAHEFVPDRSVRPLVDAYEPAFAAIGDRSAGFDLLVRGKIELPAYNGPHPYDARPVPVLHNVGWFDNIGIAHMEDYTELASRPGWAAVQYLSADATDHENYFLEEAPVSPENDHAENDAALDALLPKYTGPALDFFDVFLKGTKAVDTLPRVRWKLAHVGWQTAEAWPPPGAEELTLHLGSPEAATGPLPGGTLADATSPEEAAVQWRYNPDDLVPSAVPNTFAYLHDYPDEHATADRDDVLVFTTAVFDEPLDLAGPVDVHLDAESTAPSFDLHVRLLDIGPDGSAHLIVRGGVQRTAAGSAHAHLGHTGYRVRAGHRLGVYVASSDFPNYVPNSGSAEDAWFTTKPHASTQTLRTGAATGSRLRLTVLHNEQKEAK